MEFIIKLFEPLPFSMEYDEIFGTKRINKKIKILKRFFFFLILLNFIKSLFKTSGLNFITWKISFTLI